MKIKVVHDVCGREVLVQQIVESEGHCPWDGKAFSRDYTANLVEALKAAESAGAVLEYALSELAGMNPSFKIDRDSLIRPFEEQLDRFDERQLVMHG